MLDSAMQPGAAQKALSMQVESFWQRHGNKVLGLGAAVLLYVLWCAATFALPSASSAMALHGRTQDFTIRASVRWCPVHVSHPCTFDCINGTAARLLPRRQVAPNLGL